MGIKTKPQIIAVAVKANKILGVDEMKAIDRKRRERIENGDYIVEDLDNFVTIDGGTYEFCKHILEMYPKELQGWRYVIFRNNF